MAHFYGTLKGSAGLATRCGTKKSRMETVCASHAGAVRCQAYVHAENGGDYIRVTKIPWKGKGESRVLYDGPIGKVDPVADECDHPRHRNPGLTIPCPECERAGREGYIDNNPHFPDAE